MSGARVAALIVEPIDERFDRLFEALRAAGLDLDFARARTTAELEAEIGKRPWDVVLSGLEGGEVLAIVRQRALEIPILAITEELIPHLHEAIDGAMMRSQLLLSDRMASIGFLAAGVAHE